MTRFYLRSVVPIVRALPPALLQEDKALNELKTRLETGLLTIAPALLTVPTLTHGVESCCLSARL